MVRRQITFCVQIDLHLEELCPGVQVVYFTDALDEYLMANMPEYDDIKFQDVTKDDLKIGKDKAQKKREKKVKVID